MEQARNYRVLGSMSGTSLDGIDFALCRFEHRPFEAVSWRYSMEATTCVKYPPELHNQLRNAHLLSSERLIALDRVYSRFVGLEVAEFVKTHTPTALPDLMVSHGHTIFHAPHKGFTFQLGSPSIIAVTGGCRVLGDMRSADVALGGQGAPLVPVGDEFLFGEYDACVNLGGFANVSMSFNGIRRAWDICPLNFVMNPLAVSAGSALEYDPEGSIARRGRVIPALLDKLEALAFYQQKAPKSLGREWSETHVLPLLDTFENPSDKLRTWLEHAALRISSDLEGLQPESRVLFTGGGTHNRFLIERISELTSVRVEPGNKELIDFKEALVFAFLGALWLQGHNNVYASVTGACRDHRAGSMHEA